MKNTKNASKNGFDTSVRMLESQIPHFSPYSLRIFECDDTLAGICLLSPDLKAERIKAISDAIKRCEGITVEKFAPGQLDDKKITLLPRRKESKTGEREGDSGQPNFQESLASVAHQSSLTRIPFAVLLIQLDIGPSKANDIKSISERIQKNLNHDEIFCRYDISKPSEEKEKLIRFAIIMTTSGLSKARRRAEGIRKTTFGCKNKANKTQSMSIGLGISYAGDHIPIQDFLLSVERSLSEAVALGDSIRWERGKRSENSCQVTAEERTQLFGFLK